jgi:hypothetical protein
MIISSTMLMYPLIWRAGPLNTPHLEGRPIKQEKRKHKRIPLHFYLKVLESNTQKHLGYIIDVSEEGFKLLSEEHIPIGSELTCTLYLPEDIEGFKELSFKATACWSGKDINPNYYISGYHIDEIEPDGDTIISLIIYHYGYKV